MARKQAKQELTQIAVVTGDKEIPVGTSADQVLAEIQLICDNDTGVFMFRADRKLYMRIIETTQLA